MPTVEYDRGHAPRHREESAPRYHSTTFVRSGVEAAKVAARLSRERMPPEREPVEREPGEEG